MGEHPAVNRRVRGSNPRWGATKQKKMDIQLPTNSVGDFAIVFDSKGIAICSGNVSCVSDEGIRIHSETEAETFGSSLIKAVDAEDGEVFIFLK